MKYINTEISSYPAQYIPNICASYKEYKTKTKMNRERKRQDLHGQNHAQQRTKPPVVLIKS